MASVADKDLGLKRILSQLREGASVRVGVQGADSAIRPASSGLSLVQIATVHEFGSSDGRIPQRSFLRSTFDEKKDDLEKLIGHLLQQATSAQQVMSLTGQRYLDLVKAKIRSKIDPPLASSTLAGRPKRIDPTPLIDTGRLIGSLTAVVTVGKGGK